MPQMSPLYWLFMYTYFFILLLFMNIFIYYMIIFLNNFNKLKFEKNWFKWMW